MEIVERYIVHDLVTYEVITSLVSLLLFTLLLTVFIGLVMNKDKWLFNLLMYLSFLGVVSSFGLSMKALSEVKAYEQVQATVMDTKVIHEEGWDILWSIDSTYYLQKEFVSEEEETGINLFF